MLVLMTIIAAVLDLTVIIQRLALGGIHLLGLDGLQLRTLPAGPQKTQIVPAQPTAVPLVLQTISIDTGFFDFVTFGPPTPPYCPIPHLSATCPAQPDNDELSTATAQPAASGQALIVRTTEATDLSWLGSEAVDFEVPDDFVVSWTGDLLPHPIIYNESPPTTSVALYEPQPSGMDMYRPWIYVLGFVVLSLSVNAAFAELREVVEDRIGFIRISCPGILLDFSLRIKFSGLQYRLKDLTVQVDLRRHFSSLWLSSLVSYRLNGFMKRVHRLPYIPSLLRATIGALHILHRGFDCASIPIRLFIRALRVFLRGLWILYHHLKDLCTRTTALLRRSLRTWTVLGVSDLLFKLDSVLDSTWISIYSCIWEHDPEASMILCFGFMSWMFYRIHARYTKIIASDRENSNRDKKVLRDGLQLATHYGSLRLNHLQRKLDSTREEAVSARKTANKLHWDNQTLGHRTKEYMRVIASQTQEIKELELDNDRCHSRCVELESALEKERATVMSLRRQLSSRRSLVLSDSGTQTSPEVDIALVGEHGPDFDSCAYESLVYGTDAFDLGLPDNSYDSDSDMSECSVVEGTIFLRYTPDDGSSHSTDSDNGLSDDGDIALPSPPATDLAIHQASRHWLQHVAFMQSLYAQGIREKDGAISRLEQHLVDVNESWDFRLSQAQFLAAAQRDYIETLQAKLKAGSSVKRDLVSTRSREIKSASSTSTLDLFQLVDPDASLLLDVSFPGMPHWPSDISFGDATSSQDPPLKNTNVGPRKESTPGLTPDHPPLGRTPSTATTGLPELVITPTEPAVTTAAVVNGSAGTAETNRRPSTPYPVRYSGAKDDDDPFRPDFPSWTSFASDLSASGYPNMARGSPMVDRPIDLRDPPSPASIDDLLSPSPLASRVKRGNSGRPRQPVLSPLKIHRDL